jgi:hypothetical protein
VTAISGYTAPDRPSASSSLLLVIPGQERICRRQMALDLRMCILRLNGCVSSEKMRPTAC